MLKWKQLLVTSAMVCATSLMMVTAGAQSTTQGGIAGTVEDATGASVPKATVTITNKATNAVVTLRADEKGFFNAPLLQPGTYHVTISATGFGAFHADPVVVQVGQSTQLMPHLAAGNTTETVEVSGAAPTVNFESPDFADVIDNRPIVQLPQNNRRWSSLAMLTPGVVSDSNGFGLVSVRGISPLLNNVEIDGADDNQAYFSEERGRTREAYSTSEDAVREFTVNTGVYSAEYGRAAGGVINSVTKSGSNEFHGEAYFYDRQSNWAAYTPGVTLTTATPVSGGGFTFSNSPLKPKDLRKIYGFAAGGRIIKDKLFWYYTYDQHTHIFPGIARPNSPQTFFAQPDGALPSGQTCNTTTGLVYTGTAGSPTAAGSTIDNQACTLAARENLGSYAAGVSAYNNGLASLLPDLGSVPRVGDQEINTPKLDWQVNGKNRLALLFHRLRWDSPGGVQTASNVGYAIDTFGNDFVKLDYGLAKLESQFTNSLSNEIGYQYSRELDYETQQPYSSYTQNNLTGTGASAGNVPEVALATSSGFYLGSPYYSYRLAYPDERKWQIFDTLYMVKGNHSFKFGVDAVHNYDLINNTYESNGYYSYTYIGNYFADLYAAKSGKDTCNTGASSTASVSKGTVSSAVGSSPCYSSFTEGYGSPVYAIGTLDYGVFAQDNWKVSRRLTLELGVRYDYEFLPYPSANLTSPVSNSAGTQVFFPYAGLNNRPSDKNNVGPRIGFAYDVFGNGGTVLRGGYGLYYGRIINGTILNTYLSTGSPNGQYTSTFKGTYAGAPTLPNLSGGGGTIAAPSSYYFAPNFQNPQVSEFDLILQQNIGAGTVFNVSYLGSLGREMPNFLDLNLTNVQNVTMTFNDTTGRAPFANGYQLVVPTYTAYGNTALFGSNAAKFQNITEVVSNINSSYNAFSAEVKNRSFHGLELDASYVWSHALDYSQNAQTSTVANNWYDPFGPARANYGNSNYNVPNRITGYALYNFPGLSSGNWLKYLANNWSINDDFQLQNGLPYSLGLSGYNSNGAIATGLNGSGGITYIPALGRNEYQLKRDIVDDIRLEKGIPFGDRFNLELRSDFFNIANHQNITSNNTTGYIFSDTGTYTSTATFQSSFGTPNLVNSSGFLYTPREIQISARLAW